MNLFQILFIPACIAMCALTLLRGLRGNLGRRQSLLGSMLWALAAVFIAFPTATSVAAGWLGIGRGSDLVSYLAVLGGIAACLYFYRRCRRLEVLCTELIRREAIREAVRGDATQADERPPYAAHQP